VSGRLDVALGARDSVSFYGRTASTPMHLDSAQTDAIGAAATSTIDLDAFWLGTPSVLAVRAAFGRAVSSDTSAATVVSVRGAIEVEPRPNGTTPIYWRGTTVAGGASLSGRSGDVSLGLRVDVRTSFADSLGGRNLFPGGGLVIVRATADHSFLNPIDMLAEDADVNVAAFYSRSIAANRNNQPNRLIQTGDFLGASTTLALPWRDAVFLPNVELLRESSTTAGSRTTLPVTGVGWAGRIGLDAIIPLSTTFHLMPGAGYAIGDVSASYTRTLTIRPGVSAVQRVAVSSPVRGWSVRLELTAGY
jgi:hypothetical protein